MEVNRERFAEDDPRHHMTRIRDMLSELRDHLRKDIAKINEPYVEQVLIPALRPGQVIVVDNLLPTKVRGSRADRGARLQAAFLAALLARPQPHRGSLLEDEEPLAEGSSS
jgi:hypothetical protein